MYEFDYDDDGFFEEGLEGAGDIIVLLVFIELIGNVFKALSKAFSEREKERKAIVAWFKSVYKRIKFGE